VVSRSFTLALIAIASAVLISCNANALLFNLGHLLVVHVALEAPIDFDAEGELIAQLLVNNPFSPSRYQVDQWMWMAEAYGIAKHWDRSYAAYQMYKSLGGDISWAMARLRSIAIYHNWCLNQNNRLFSLANTLSDAAQSYELVGEVCEETNNLNQAINAFRNSFYTSRSKSGASALAWILFQRGELIKAAEPEKSNRDFREIVSIFETLSTHPDNNRDRYVLAWSYWQLNKFDEAIETYRECISDDSYLDRFVFSCAMNLGHAYSKWLPEGRQDLQKAFSYYERARHLAFDDVSRFEANRNLGQVALMLKYPEIARDYLEQAVQFDSSCLECRLGLGEALRLLNDLEAATQQYKEILRLYPGEMHALEYLKELEGNQ
jgi:tetratricopeptide (TPR) repeat protein